MPSVKRHLFTTTSLLVLSVIVLVASNQSSTLKPKSSVTGVVYRSLSDSFSFFRKKDEIISYTDDKNLMKLHLMAMEKRYAIERAFIYNSQTKVRYLYLEDTSYPIGNYEITLHPKDYNLYKDTLVNGNLTKTGNHIVRYALNHQELKTTSSGNIEQQVGFNFNIDKLQENSLEVGAFNWTEEDNIQNKQKWVSGKIFLNTTPRHAHVEILEPKKMSYFRGMTLDERIIKVKVSASNYIYTIKEFRLSQGKNIFVVPLRPES